MEDWDIASQVYQVLLRRTGTPYSQVATKMLNLIGILREDTKFQNLMASTSMMTLQLAIHGKKGSINISWLFKEGLFQVSIDFRKPPYEMEYETVEETEIITKIQEKLQILDTFNAT